LLELVGVAHRLKEVLEERERRIQREVLACRLVQRASVSSDEGGSPSVRSTPRGGGHRRATILEPRRRIDEALYGW
jgi:hypothetical protein